MSEQPRSTFVLVHPSEILAALVGLKDVRVLTYERHGPDVELMIEQVAGDVRCPICAGHAQVKERPVVHYVDLPVYGTPMSLAWKKHRMRCENPACTKRSWVLFGPPRIAAKNCLLTTRAAKWPRSKWAGAGPSQKWQPSSPVTGTRSTTPCAPMARPCWRRIANA